MTIEEVAPDNSTISRFRTLMTKKKAYDQLFKEINAQLENHSIIVKTGVLVDASIVDTPLKPKGKVKYKIAEDRELEPRNSEEIDKEVHFKKIEKQEQ